MCSVAMEVVRRWFPLPPCGTSFPTRACVTAWVAPHDGLACVPCAVSGDQHHAVMKCKAALLELETSMSDWVQAVGVGTLL